MTEFIKGIEIVDTLMDIEMVEVVDIPYNIDPQELNQKAREFVEKNPEIVEAAIKKVK